MVASFPKRTGIPREAARSPALRPSPAPRFSTAILALLLSSCWSPAFDPGLAEAALAARGMASVADLHVEGIKERSATRGLFIPRRSVAPLDGIWFQGYGDKENTYNSITPYYLASGPASAWLSTPASSFSSVPDRPLVALAPAATPTSLLEAAGVAGGDGGWNAGRIFEPADARYSLRLESNPSGSLSNALLLGVGFRALSQGSDELTIVYRDNASGTWYLAAFSYGAGFPSLLAPAPPAAGSELSPVAGFTSEPLASPGYATRIDGIAYLSLRLEDGSTATYRWSNGQASAPERLPGIAHPLAAALSDGTLLARDGSFLRAYGPDGEARYSLRLGSLRLAHERWDEASAAFVAVFVGQAFAPTSGEEGTLRLEVFESPTEELAALAESLD